MIDDLLFGLGFVAVIEGLVLALAPSRLEDIVAALRDIGPDRMRFLGLMAIALGVLLIWLSR